MPRIPPTPRNVPMSFYSPGETAQINPDGTWLEPESICYPSGRMLRRAYVRHPDGVLRVVKCGIPDTYFSIPAITTYAGAGNRVKGYITGRTNDDGAPTLVFVPYQKQS